MNDRIYYVYLHVDPRNDELLYIGHGCRGRAWIHGSRKTCLRAKEHLDHLDDMTNGGFLPSDWVEIIYRGLSKKEACKEEQRLIRELSPTYNKKQGVSLIKLSEDSLEHCKILRSDGLSYEKIALEVGVSTMTVYRALNNQTKNIGDVYGS